MSRDPILSLALLLKEYDPAKHPRDAKGRWTKTGTALTHDPKKKTWRDAEGKEVSEHDLERLRKLGVPPAWVDVRLNPNEVEALQAVGRDKKGRMQYKYSAEHSEKAAAEKFARLKEFNEALPGIRAAIESDLASPDTQPADREAALVLRLIDRTGFRIGSDDDTGAEQQAYGATTLMAEHVSVTGDRISFKFVGKKGVTIEKVLDDAMLAREIGARVAVGDRLFNTTDAAVRDYLHKRGGDFKVKDFRTWNGTSRALREIEAMPEPTTEKEFKKAQLAVSKVVAEHLGNTPTVARQSYIDPAVWGRWQARVKGMKKAMSDRDRMAEFLETTSYSGRVRPWRDVRETEESEDEPS